MKEKLILPAHGVVVPRAKKKFLIIKIPVFIIISLSFLLTIVSTSYSQNNQSVTAPSVVGKQQISVTGKVTNSSNVPLPGVTVSVKGSTASTITDANGD